MLQFRVFAKFHSRRSRNSFLSQTPIPSSPSPNSHGINLFADPHPLIPVPSIFYKCIGGRGAAITPGPVLPSPTLSSLNATLRHAFVCVANKGLTERLNPLDATLTKNRGRGVSWLTSQLSARLSRPSGFDASSKSASVNGTCPGRVGAFIPNSFFDFQLLTFNFQPSLLPNPSDATRNALH